MLLLQQNNIMYDITNKLTDMNEQKKTSLHGQTVIAYNQIIKILHDNYKGSVKKPADTFETLKNNG